MRNNPTGRQISTSFVEERLSLLSRKRIILGLMFSLGHGPS
jgi:hypothetical protein